MLKTLLIPIALVAVVGCGSPQRTATGTTTSSASTAQASLSPEELGTLGAKISRSPKDADKMLSDRGMDEKSFEAAIRKVSEDPEASKRYAAAFRNSGGVTKEAKK